MGANLRQLRILSNQRGMVIVYVTIVLVVLMGMLGLAVDLGHMEDVRGELQNDADAAALAGATCLFKNTGGSYSLDWPTALSTAQNFVARNKSDNTALSDGTVEVGYYDVTWLPGSNNALLPTSTPPGALTASDVPAVKVTVARNTGQNGGEVPTTFMRALGIDSAAVSSRPSVAVRGYASSAPPGKLFPIALSSCMTNDYFKQDPLPDLASAPEIYIYGPYDKVPGCDTGQWTSFGLNTPSDSVIQGFLKNPSTVPAVNYGDPIYIDTGAKANLYNITNSDYVGQDVIMAIVDNVDKALAGTTPKVVGFATFHIDGATGSGATKQVWGRFVSYSQTLPGASAGGTVSNVLSMPQVVQ